MTRAVHLFLLIALGTALMLPTAVAGAAPSIGAAPGLPTPGRATASGPCAGGSGVTVVVDFQELGGGVQTRCAPGQPSSGLDALTRAGVAFTGTVRFPGFVCRIAGRPAQDRCIDTSPSSAYWSYWVADRGGSWCYSTTGAASRRPPEGTVEGWSFSLNRPSNQPPAPRGALPPAAAGGGRLPAGECDAAIAPPPTSPAPAPAPAPPPRPATPPSAGAAPGGAVAPPPIDPNRPGGAAPAPSPAPGAAESAGAADGGGSGSTGDSATSDATREDGTEPTDDAGDPDDAGDADDAGDPDDATGAEVLDEQLDADDTTDDGELAAASDAGDPSGDGGAGSGALGVLAALGLIGGLGGAAAYRSRRRARAAG